MPAGRTKRRASMLPLILLFSILTGLGGLLLTTKPLSSSSAPWQDTLRSMSPYSSIHSNIDKAKEPYYPMLQHYSAWLTQQSVPMYGHADSDKHVAHDSWQQHIVPSLFMATKADSESASPAAVASGSTVWQSLSAQMLVLRSTCSQLSNSWMSKLPQLLPRSWPNESAMQSQLMAASVAEGVVLKPELMWRHVSQVMQRLSAVLRKSKQLSDSDLNVGKTSRVGSSISLCTPEAALSVRTSLTTFYQFLKSNTCTLQPGVMVLHLWQVHWPG